MVTADALAGAGSGDPPEIPPGRRLATVAAGAAAAATGVCYVLSTGRFFPYCPSGSLAPWFAIVLYVAIVVLLALSSRSAAARKSHDTRAMLSHHRYLAD
ncbi:hypothetical protein Ssi02_09640 [Sinosporangium siamense]|uniref:Uncharacterized protein n=1 Tax=Sinosporangium siamense TaxID=1367973 RepID=A0A919RBA3_9ACTN|nr:hypothetical protein Ssi02_09640 [Sinosporangium siamense]